jgi:hypothetical protein
MLKIYSGLFLFMVAFLFWHVERRNKINIKRMNEDRVKRGLKPL